MTCEVGGWLAPAFRHRGLGFELFEAACLFAHERLGASMLRAGAEKTNLACQAALTAAGSQTAHGSTRHVTAVWSPLCGTST